MNLSLIKQGVRHMFLQDTLITLLSPLIVRSLSSPRSKRMGLRSLSRLSDVLPPLRSRVRALYRAIRSHVGRVR